MKKFLDLAGTVIGYAVLFSLVYVAVDWYLSIPDVYYSWSDRECVGVIDSRGNPQPCDPLPERYNQIWVR